jgi:DNA-directed RNA polymerase specialized sigma24 family protein
MQGDGAGEEVAAARARNLQPEDGRPDARRLLGAPVTSQDLRAMNGRQTKEARRQQASIDRRLADGRLVAMLEQDGFQGPLYDRFVEELVRYGISVLRGWMHSGYIFELAAQRGFGLNPHELDLEDLATDSDLREELATMTIARALPRFRQQALVDKGWTPEGGASITTYFMGACAYDFPNEFRRHRTSEARQHRALRREKELYSPPVSRISVAEGVLGNLRVLDELGEITDPRLKAVVALTLDGYSQEEIRELVDAATVRAVEGLMYRWRTKAKQNRRGERDD